MLRFHATSNAPAILLNGSIVTIVVKQQNNTELQKYEYELLTLSRGVSMLNR